MLFTSQTQRALEGTRGAIEGRMGGSLLALLAVSLAGVVLLPVFGAVLHFQPQLVHGLHVDPQDGERNCYLAAGCYGVTLLLSGVALWLKRRRAAAAEAAAARDALHALPGYAAVPVRRSLTPREKKLLSLATGDADEQIQKPPKDKKTKTKRASPRKPASTDSGSKPVSPGSKWQDDGDDESDTL